MDAADAASRGRLARVYFYGGDADAAIREWRNVLHTRPRDATVYQGIARVDGEQVACAEVVCAEAKG